MCAAISYPETGSLLAMTFRKVEEMFGASRVPGVHKATGMWDVCPIWALMCPQGQIRTRNICSHPCWS